MQKAKSRLNRTAEEMVKSRSVKLEVPVASVAVAKLPVAEKVRVKVKKTVAQKVGQRGYLVHLPLPFLALICFWILRYLLTHFYPAQLADLPVVGSYGLVMLILFLAGFFLFSYVFLSSKLGFWLSLVMSLAVFLRLHHVW